MNRKIFLISGTIILLQLLMLQGCEKNRAGEEVRLIIPTNKTEYTCFIWAVAREDVWDIALKGNPNDLGDYGLLLSEGTLVVILEEQKKKKRVKVRILEGPYCGEIVWTHIAFLPK